MSFILAGCSTSLIGQKVPPYPEGSFSQAGACITGHLGYERMCEYSIGILETDKKEIVGLLAKRSLKKKEDDPNTWIVTDHINYPDIQKGYWFAFGTCRINEKRDETVVAIVKNTETEYQQAHGWAQKINLESGKFEKINPSLVTCFNEGWGL